MKCVITSAIMALGFIAGVAGQSEADRFKGGSFDGWHMEEMSSSTGLGGPKVTLSSGINQTFDWTLPGAWLAPLSVSVLENQGAITNGGVIRIALPRAWRSRFDPAGSNIQVSGDHAYKLGGAAFSVDQRALEIGVTEDFEDGDGFQVEGLRLTDLHLGSPNDHRLEIYYTGTDQPNGFDEYTVRVQVLWAGGAYDGWDTLMNVAVQTLRLLRGTLILVR